MQITGLAIVATWCVVFVAAIPNSFPPALADHGPYEKRAPDVTVLTQTVTQTVTDNNAIVWVNANGEVMSTEHKDGATASPQTDNAPSVSTPDITTSVASASDVAVNARQGDDGSATSVTFPASVSATTTTAAVSATATSTDNINTAPAGAAVAVAAAAGFNVAYDPIGPSGCRDANSDFQALSQQGIKMVRVYDLGCPLTDYVNAAAKYNLRLMLGLNSIANVNDDVNTLARFVQAASTAWSVVDTIYVGNEIVGSGAGSSAQVQQAVSVAKGVLTTLGYAGHVITIDTVTAIQNDPTICSSADYCGANAHPFFDATNTADQSSVWLRRAYTELQGVMGGKRVVITETGWPHAGQANGAAVPGDAQQKSAFDGILRDFQTDAASVYLFQAFDATYKQPGAFGVEPFWGIAWANL